jgi:hypothetical protein
VTEREDGMKEVKFCFEVQGMAKDAGGNPSPAGLSISLGEVAEEKFDALMESAKSIKADDLLRYLGFDPIASGHQESDFRRISPEEYALMYGGEGEH